MKTQTIKVNMNLVTPTQDSGCDECIVSQISGMQCPANDKGELLCDAPLVWKVTHWRDASSLAFEVKISK